MSFVWIQVTLYSINLCRTHSTQVLHISRAYLYISQADCINGIFDIAKLHDIHIISGNTKNIQSIYYNV